MPTPYPAMEPHIDGSAAEPQGPMPQHVSRYWSAFAATIALAFAAILWSVLSPRQDHLGSISLHGDGTWYHNYEIASEVPDLEILLYGIGHSIQNAQQADIIFLGTSKLLFGMDWRLFEDFEQKHHLKMFNMGLAGVPSGGFSLRVIRKWGLHPKLWLINSDLYWGDFRSGFFYMAGADPATVGTNEHPEILSYDRLRALKKVLGRNIRWRLKMAIGLLKQDPYRSAKTGNWYLVYWPNQTLDNNAMIKSKVDSSCPEIAQEVDDAKGYIKAIGGTAILMQVPSAFSCTQRLRELAVALAVPAFSVAPEQFSTTDGGGHLDRISARRYSTMFFAWLEQQPEFQRLFPQ